MAAKLNWHRYGTELRHCRPMHSAIIVKTPRFKSRSQHIDIDSIMDDMDMKFLRRCFPKSTVYILYSLQSKVIRTGSALETTTFSSQSATILVAGLLLYVVFFDLNRFFIVFVCFPDCQLLFFLLCSVYFTFSTIAMSLLLSHDLRVRLLRVVQ